MIYFKILKEFGKKKWVFGHKLFSLQKEVKYGRNIT